MSYLIWAILVVATVVPLLKLLPHFGINKNWAFACVISPVAVILLWAMAMKLQDMERK